MNSERNQLVEQSAEQANPYLCDPRSFEVIEADAPPAKRPPFHNQCGSTRSEYETLLREGEKAANAPNFAEAEQHPDVNRAGRPHGDGVGSRK